MVSSTSIRAADREAQIQALRVFLAAEPEHWPQLVPQMLHAVGAARLRGVVETARRRLGGFEAVKGSTEGLVIIGPRERALVWVLLDEQAELTNLLIGARGPRRVLSQFTRLRLAAMTFPLLVWGAAFAAWMVQTSPLCVVSAILALIWPTLMEVDAPAVHPWWFRRGLEIGGLAGLIALVRVRDLPFGDGDPVGPFVILVPFLWMIAEALLKRRHRWGRSTSVQLQLPVRGRWYVADAGAPDKLTRSKAGSAPPPAGGAVDLLQVGRWGPRRSPWPGLKSSRRHGRRPRPDRDQAEGADEALESYLAYGQSVYSPCAGTVVEAVDGLTDQVPGEARFAPPGGNHIFIDTGQETIRLFHLRAGSIQVDAGQNVNAGQLLAEVGNSGRSAQPQLGIDAVRDGRRLDLVFTGIHGTLHSGRTVHA